MTFSAGGLQRTSGDDILIAILMIRHIRMAYVRGDRRIMNYTQRRKTQ